MKNAVMPFSLLFIPAWEVLRTETLGGFFQINAKDMNEATQVAAQWPSARLGNIEVRPIEDDLKEDKRYA